MDKVTVRVTPSTVPGTVAGGSVNLGQVGGREGLHLGTGSPSVPLTGMGVSRDKLTQWHWGQGSRLLQC